MTRRQQALSLLQQLGLSELESEVYVYLLGHPPATAYRVAKAIGKATANTYKAIDSLSRRGAVLVEEGGSRMCRAVPPEDFLNGLERGFATITRQAEAALAKMERAAPDEGAFRLDSVSQVLERCRQMLEERAEKLAVIDAFPVSLESIQPYIATAVQRGIEVVIQAYRPVEIPGADVVIVERGPDAEAQWGSQQLNLAIDGREALVALLSQDLGQVWQAVWTNSLYLACILEAGILSEQTIHRLRAVQDARDAANRMRQILDRHRFFLNTAIPGQKELLARFAEGDSDAVGT